MNVYWCSIATTEKFCGGVYLPARTPEEANFIVLNQYADRFPPEATVLIGDCDPAFEAEYKPHLGHWFGSLEELNFVFGVQMRTLGDLPEGERKAFLDELEIACECENCTTKH